MDLPVNKIDKKQAKELLDELNHIYGPQKLADWNIKAHTFLVFNEIKRICSRTKRNIANQADKLGLFE